MGIKPSLCLGSKLRAPVPSFDDWPGHRQFIVRSQSEYIAALNQAWSQEQYSLIILGKAGMTVVPPVHQGRTTAKEIITVGGFGEQTEGFTGTSGQILGLFGSTRFGFCNLFMDGREGRTQKGVVLGSANGDADGRHAPVTDCWFSHLDIYGVEQQLFMIGDNSADILLQDVDLHDNGHGMGEADFAEGFYMGKGGNRRTNPTRISVERMAIYDITGGEAFDMKVDTTHVTADWLDIQNVKANYSGAITIGIDNHDGGHGQDNDVLLSNVYVNNVDSLRWSVSAVQAGTGATIRNFWFENVHKGAGVNTLAQAVGPNRTLVLDNGYMNDCAQGWFKENTSTLVDKSKAVSPMSIVGKDTVAVGPLNNLSREQMAMQVFRFVPPVTPPLPPPPVVVPPSPPDVFDPTYLEDAVGSLESELVALEARVVAHEHETNERLVALESDLWQIGQVINPTDG